MVAEDGLGSGGKFEGTLLQVITITSCQRTPANNGTHPNWDRTPTQAASTCFLLSIFTAYAPEEEGVVEEEEEVMPRRILCKIHVRQAKLTSLTAVKSVSVINTPNVNLNSRRYLCIHSHR